MKKAVWITWENQRRNKTLSNALGVPIYQLEANTHRLIRYPVLAIRTLWIFISSRADIIFAQNPSIILATLATLFGIVSRKKIVIDAHNAGVYPFEGQSSWATRLVRFLFRNCHLTIVTNTALKEYIESQDGKAFVLPDPFPVLSCSDKKPLRGNINFLLICTWAVDEPYAEAIQAFSALNDDYVLYVTGNSKGRENNLPFPVPENVTLTGYVSDEEFDRLLHSCDCVIDLTTRDDCLVCGAYEAVAAGKPLILSDTKALRYYFKDAALYTQNTSDDIKKSISQVVADLEKITQDVLEYRERQKEEWNAMKDQLAINLHMTDS